MIITALSLRNWMNITTADLLFQRGINVLAGRFGQGKSAILEAIAFCLLKDHKKGSTWEDYLKRDADSGSIHLEVQMSESPEDLMVFDYELTRGADVAKKVSYNHVDYSTNSQVNEFLGKRLDQEMLKNITFLMQGGQTINEMTPAQRRDIFKKIFNSEFPLVLDAIDQDAKTLVTKETNKKIQIEGLKVKTYPIHRLIEVDAQEIETLRVEYTLAQDYINLKSQYDQFLGTKLQLERARQRLAGHITSQDANLAQIAGYRTQIATLKDTDTRLMQESITLADAVTLQDTHVMGLRTKAEALKQDELRKMATDPVPGINDRIRIERGIITEASAKKQVIAIHKATHERGECTQCGQKTDAGKIPEMDKELADLEVLITNANAQIKKYEDEGKVYREELAVIRYNITTASEAVSTANLSLVKVQGELKAKNIEIVTNAEKVKALETNITTTQERVFNLSDSIGGETLLIQGLEDSVVKNTMEEPKPTDRPPSAIQEEIDELITLVAGNAEKIKMNNATQAEKEKDTTTLQTYNEELNELQLRIKRLKVVKKKWEVEFPNYMNLTGCSILQDQMNKFFDRNRKGFTVKLNASKKGVEFNYKVGEVDKWGPAVMTSGFEGAMLTLSFKTAVARVSGSALIFLDEPDANAGGEESIRVFDTILNMGAFQQQFVISHKPEAVSFLKDNGALVYYVKEGVFSQYPVGE